MLTISFLVVFVLRCLSSVRAVEELQSPYPSLFRRLAIKDDSLEPSDTDFPHAEPSSSTPTTAPSLVSSNVPTTNPSLVPSSVPSDILSQEPSEVPTTEDRVVFVTSTKHTGNLGGIVGATQICQTLADSPQSTVPSGIYRPFLSTSNVDARDLIAPSIPRNVRYILPDGTVVASSTEELFSTISGSSTVTLQATIARSERNEPVENGVVWSGSDPQGILFESQIVDSSACNDWTFGQISFNIKGMSGNTLRRDFQWSRQSFSFCSSELHLYCFQVE